MIGPGTVPTWTEAAPVVGESERIVDVPETQRPAQVAFRLAARLVRTHFVAARRRIHGPGSSPAGRALPAVDRTGGAGRARMGPRPPHPLHLVGGTGRGRGLRGHPSSRQTTGRRGCCRCCGRSTPQGSTPRVGFLTRKVAIATDRRALRPQPRRARRARGRQHLGGADDGAYAEAHPRVAAYVKNDHLGFTIPYVHQGRSHDYVPDFLLRLRRADGEDVDRTLIVEVSGGQKSSTRPVSRRRPRPPATVVRGRQQPRRVRPLGLRRGHPHAHAQGTTLDAAIQTLYDDGPISATSTVRVQLRDRGRDRLMPPRKKKPSGPKPVEAITHADKRANLPTADAQRVRRRREIEEARRSSSTARPDARPAARLEGQDATSPTVEDLRQPTPRRSTSRRRSTRGSWSRTCAEPRPGPRTSPSCTLFETFDGLDELDLVEFYQHQANWSNRMILGDSLQVMASLAEREALRGKVQMIYIDPPYGIKFGSNWQVSRPQARRQGRQGRGRRPRGRADQGLPRHLGAGHPLLPVLPARPADRRAGPAHRERVAASSRSGTRTSTSCGA